jgi:quercetin dioxygenase-like cupin family protein
MRKRIELVVVFALGAICASGISAQDHSIVLPGDVRWQPLPREWIVGTVPPGTQVRGEVAVIYGDPNKAGEPFVIRLKSPPNSILPAHWHEFDEYITVLSGVWCVGMGDRIDPNSCTDLAANSFILIPRRMRHWAVTKDSVVEVHGIGPFRAYLVQ